MNNNLGDAINNLNPGEHKKVILDYTDIEGKKVLVRIRPELSADEIFDRTLNARPSKVIPFRVESEKMPLITGSINKEPMKRIQSRFSRVRDFIKTKYASLKQSLGTPEYNLNYYVDEKGRKYEINVDGVRVYFDDTRPNLVYEYHIMIDEFGNSWEYIVLEGGVLGIFLNPERTIIEVDGVAYNFTLEGIDYDHPLDFYTRH